MQLIHVPNSKEAIRRVSQEMSGKIIRIVDVWTGQNVLVEEGYWKRKLDPAEHDCMDCLIKSGYRQPMQLPFYRHENSREFISPKLLSRCKAALNGIISTITVKTDDGTTFIFALLEGCSGGIGRIGDGTVTPLRPDDERTDEDRIYPVVFPDPDAVPVSLNTVLVRGQYTRTSFTFAFT